MSQYTVVHTHGRTKIWADEYRQSSDGDLYFYEDDVEDPVGMFPEGAFLAVFDSDAGSYTDLD